MSPLEDLITKLVAVSPIAAALIVLVVLFLRHIQKRDASWEQAVKDMNDKQLMSHDKCSDAVRKNTEVMGRVKQLLETRIKQVGGEHG